MTSNINYYLMSTYNGLLLDGAISMINKNNDYLSDDKLNYDVMVLGNLISKNISLAKLAELSDPANGILESKYKSFKFITSTLHEINSTLVLQKKTDLALSSPNQIPLDIFNKLIKMLTIYVQEYEQ